MVSQSELSWHLGRGYETANKREGTQRLKIYSCNFWPVLSVKKKKRTQQHNKWNYIAYFHNVFLYKNSHLVSLQRP